MGDGLFWAVGDGCSLIITYRSERFIRQHIRELQYDKRNAQPSKSFSSVQAVLKN